MGEGPQLKTDWDDIKCFDDIVPPGNKEIISDLEKAMEKRCPYLRKMGNFFYYCGINVSGEPDLKPSPRNPIYQSILGVADLQLWCMADYEICERCCAKFKKTPQR